MNIQRFSFYLLSILSFFPATQAWAQDSPLAKPSAIQYRWQEQERIMFIHFGVATWLGQEYDETGAFDLSRINPQKLNTDQWCQVAQSWGAKQIIFVAKHAGGFCWWQTQTTEYGVRNTPWKNGKGDVLHDLAVSCKKAGLNLGVYIYPGDIKWGAGLGSGGVTKDPNKQAAYNQVFRQQLTEVLTRYGNMLEVWFDGSCKVPMSDILKKHAKKAVIFQSTDASIRWPGTESGRLHYPVWNSLNSSMLKTGVATQYDDDPDGDAWAPLEADVPLYNHNWFWAPKNEQKRRSLPELMEIYYQSVGHGGTLLLNATPDTTGLIPLGDVQCFAEFGHEIDRRFAESLLSIQQRQGTTFELNFAQPSNINHTILREDYRQGHRIRQYTIEGLVEGKWVKLAKGSSVGTRKIDFFPTTKVSKLRLQITNSINTPLIRSFAAFNVDDFIYKAPIHQSKEWSECGIWDTKNFTDGKGELTVDLTPFIQQPGQYEVTFLNSVNITGMWVEKAEVILDQDPNTLQEFITRKAGENTFYINRTAQVDRGNTSVLKVKMSSDNRSFQNKGTIVIRKRIK